MDSGMGYIEAPHFPKYVWQNNGTAKQMVWDTSSLSAFSSCPRYYNYQNLLDQARATRHSCTTTSS